MSIVRGYGFIPELDGQHDVLCGVNRDVGELFGAPTSLPSEAMALVNALPALKNQGESNSCVAHGIANGAETRLKAIGLSPPPSAVRQIYTQSNELLRRTKNEKLRDDGTYARTAMKACADFGVAHSTDWPLYDASGHLQDVTKEVPPGVLQHASAWKLREQFSVYATGQARLNAVCGALVNLNPLPCAGQVDTVFEAYNGSGVIPAPDPAKLAGGHMTCIVAYRTNVAGKREFMIVNSWSDWGLQSGHSLAWVSEEWVLALQEIYGLALTH